MKRFQFLAVISLPQEAFQHSGAGVKASIVFLRKRGPNEQPKDTEPIFMAAPSNIGYDATGHKTARIALRKQDGNAKVEVHSTELYDVEVTFERAPKVGPEQEEWQEKSRRVARNTGVLGQYRQFVKKPAPFFL
jgi:type I restriction enzyme M protein